MLNFKPRSNKKIIAQKNKSSDRLDIKHNEFLEKFRNNDEVIIPKLKDQIKEKKKELKNNKNKEYIENEINEIKNNIKFLNNEKKQYYLNNSEIIFNYFEKKKEVSDGTNKTTILNNFFNTNVNPNINPNVNPNVNPNSNEYDDKQINQTESAKYFMNINKNYVDLSSYIENTDICELCNGELVAVESDGILVCKNCGNQSPYLIEHEKPSYKEPPKEVCFYAYKKLNHFKEILAQFQAKETTHIPDKVLEDVLNQIKKERIKLEDFTHIKAKEILKKLSYNKYYEHISFIKDKLGIRPPIMSLELEEKLISLFLETQKPYAKYCPEDRLNYLNYYYVLYKLCEILGETYYLQFCPMLKDPMKKIDQDNIWKKICQDLKWNFIPTVI
jgi:hypothetical protein